MSWKMMTAENNEIDLKKSLFKKKKKLPPAHLGYKHALREPMMRLGGKIAVL
jgi:hypothetical protein